MAYTVYEYWAIKSDGARYFVGVSDDGSGIDRHAKERATRETWPLVKCIRATKKVVAVITPDTDSPDLEAIEQANKWLEYGTFIGY